MLTANQNAFVHRKNHDGSFDTICTACYQTAGQHRIEAHLLSSEAQHACLHSDLVRLGKIALGNLMLFVQSSPPAAPTSPAHRPYATSILLIPRFQPP